MKTNLKTPKLKVEVISPAEGRWEVLVPASSVRLGETSRELVKSKDCVDYLRLVTTYVGKTEKECKKWLDANEKNVVRIGIPYEVAPSP